MSFVGELLSTVILSSKMQLEKQGLILSIIGPQETTYISLILRGFVQHAE